MTEYSPELLEAFARIGQKLKAGRETRAISINEISASTKIHPGFLEKIENGDLENLPNLAFVKGFVRNFIQALGLEDPDLEAEIRALNPKTDEDAKQVMPVSQVHLLEVEERRFSLVKLGVYLVLFAALGGIGYFLYIGIGDENTDPPGKSADTTQVPAKKPNENGAKPAGEKGAGKTSPATKTGSAPPPQAQAAPKNLNLTIRGLERTWVRLTIDKKPPVDVLMEISETQRWEADQEFRLIVGKSQGVAVFLNGLDFPLPKEPNRLIPEMVLDKLALLKLENCSTQGGC